MDYLSTVMEIGVKPRSESDQRALAAALEELRANDSTLYSWTDPESGDTIIGGTSEPHLESVIHALIRTYEISLEVGTPTISFRETISKTIDVDYTHNKQRDGARQFARIKVRFEPLKPAQGFVFESTVGRAAPPEYIAGVEKGIASACESGVLTGFPVIDFKATLIDCTHHDVDSSVLAFEKVAHAAFREGMEKAGPKLLEPIMGVEVVVPEEHMGDVIGDLNSRRGQIQGMDSRGDSRVVLALVPLPLMFGYGAWLRSQCGTTASFSINFSHYEQVPSLPDGDPPFRPAAAMRA